MPFELDEKNIDGLPSIGEEIIGKESEMVEKLKEEQAKQSVQEHLFERQVKALEDIVTELRLIEMHLRR